MLINSDSELRNWEPTVALVMTPLPLLTVLLLVAFKVVFDVAGLKRSAISLS